MAFRADDLFCFWKGGGRMNVLTIQNLSKSFGGQKIIDNLTMTVPEGSVFGLIGQNGAGKTTIMKMVLGLLQPDSGKIHVCNESVCFGQTKTNQYIGYLPDVPEFYNYMSPSQYLRLCGEVIGISKAETERRCHKTNRRFFSRHEAAPWNCTGIAYTAQTTNL